MSDLLVVLGRATLRESGECLDLRHKGPGMPIPTPPVIRTAIS
ncbi:hypothetical protein ACYOEI_09385 [Singulisphaera rosea]